MSEPHNDHPLRHYDRTCQACIASEELKVALPELPQPDGTVEVVDGVDEASGGNIVRYEPAWSAGLVQAYALQAVEAERERCAKLVAELDCAHRCGVGHEVAAAILGTGK